MKEYQLCLALCLVTVMAAAAPSNPVSQSETPAPPDTYGSIAVSRVIHIAPDGTLLCDIDALPPVIGKNIPVILEGIEPLASAAVDKEVLAFLEQTLNPKSSAAPSIVLNNIRRGPTFCLIAEIEIDGKDLARMLVEKGLARRIIRLETADNAPSNSNPAAPLQIKPAETASGSYVAAKSSKIFHRPTCPHAKRIAPAAMLTLRTRQEAEQNGRRPCKTCNP